MRDQSYYDICWDRTFEPEEDLEEKERAYWEKGDRDYDLWKEEQGFDD